MSGDAALHGALARSFAGHDLKKLGVAVSGGSDSLGLLHLAAEWSAQTGIPVCAATVNHGLRAEASDEAVGVAAICATLGIPHDILLWQGWDGAGNLQDQARRARIGLMAGWAGLRGIDAVALGHTADDQAETVLMRLARGSGVDGLSGMAPWRRALGVEWARPLLGVRRAEIRAYLTRRGQVWADDPSNEDDHYTRVKMRKALAVLEGLGIDAAGLGGTAARMRSARQVLEQAAGEAAREIGRVQAGDVLFERGPLMALLAETRMRLLAHALAWVASADYRPRQADLTRMEALLAAGTSCTLHGCQITVTPGLVRIAREYQAVRAVSGPVGQVWDQRWQLSGPETNGLRVAALGAHGLAECADWRETGLPRPSLLASPAVWFGAALVAAPLAGVARGWTARLVRGEDSFYTSLLSH